MVNDSETRRVEVELTPIGEPARSPYRDGHGSERRGAVPGVASRVDSGRTSRTTGESSGRTPRSIVVVVVIAIVVLAGSRFLGDTGASGPPVTDESDAAAATPVADGTGESGPESADSGRQAAPRPRGARTNVTLPGPQTGTVTLHPALDGADFRIVGVVGSNTTAEIDVRAEEMVTRNWGAVNLEQFPAVIGEGWIMSLGARSGSVRVLTADGHQSNPRLGGPWSLVPAEGGDRFWRPTDPQSAPFVRFEEVDRAGEPTGTTIETDGVWPAGVDPAGGILTVVQGSTYAIGPDGVELVGEGEMVAVSETHAVLHRCDETLACDLVLVDRSTGADRHIDGGPDVLPAAEFEGFSLRSELAPDGAAVGVVTSDDRGRPTLYMVDTGSGETQTLSEEPESGISWSPDGRFGFFVEAAVLKFYDRVTGTVETAGPDVGAWRTVDVRGR